jgi:hypothetical protein
MIGWTACALFYDFGGGLVTNKGEISAHFE